MRDTVELAWGTNAFRSVWRTSTMAVSVVVLWDLTAHKPLHHLGIELEMLGVQGLAFTPDGKMLATANGTWAGKAGPIGSFISLWDTTNGKLLFTLPELDETHTGLKQEPQLAVATSSDGLLLASGDDSGSVRLWEVNTGKEFCVLKHPDTAVFSLAFSPDSRTLAAALSNNSVLVWDMTPPRWKLPTESRDRRTREAQRLWAELGGQDPARAYRVMWTLTAYPDQAVALAKANLRSVRSEPPARIRQYIADLDDDSFERREEALRTLSGLKQQAEPALREALRETSSPELRRRVTALLDSLDRWPLADPNTLRALRAVWVLEHIGTLEACAILGDLASGAREARLTRAARGALAALDCRSRR
jgi:dipeptidyl aminopeptidase/acylaminoacyl peptidase